MPLPPIPVPVFAPALTIGGSVTGDLAVPAPHIYVLEAPKKGLFGAMKQLGFEVSGQVPTNLGVYGPNPPVLDGAHGKLAAPAVGVYQGKYQNVRVLEPGRYYVVVRFQGDPGPYTIKLTDRGYFHL